MGPPVAFRLFKPYLQSLFTSVPYCCSSKQNPGGSLHPKITHWITSAKPSSHVSNLCTRSRDWGRANREGPIILQIFLLYIRIDSSIFSAVASGKEKSSPQNSIQSDAVHSFNKDLRIFCEPGTGERRTRFSLSRELLV